MSNKTEKRDRKIRQRKGDSKEKKKSRERKETEKRERRMRVVVYKLALIQPRLLRIPGKESNRI